MMYRTTSPVSLTSSPTGKMRRSNSRGFDQMKPLAAGFVPGEDDVLVGRGKKCLVHTGNIRFKAIVATKLSAYLAAECRVDKTAILMEVIAEVRINSPNGGFVKQNPKTGQFFEVGDFLAKEKTAQAFRDALHEYYSSSNPSKKKRRVQSTNSTDKKPAVSSSNKCRSVISIAEEGSDSEVTFVESSQERQPSLVSAMHTQFTSSIPTQFTSGIPTTFTALRKTKSAPPSPTRDNLLDDAQRSHTPPPSFARFVSAEPTQDMDTPLPLMMGEEITSMEMPLMESLSQMKGKASSDIIGDTLAVLSSALSETGFVSEVAPLNNGMQMPMNGNDGGLFVNDDPFEPIPLAPMCENMAFSNLS